jgi:hypothetical protein
VTERPLQLFIIGALALLVFGAMGFMYVQSLSLPKCTAHHITANDVVRPEEIRCRK